MQSFEGKANELDEAKKELSEFKREYSALENQMKTIVSEQSTTSRSFFSFSVFCARRGGRNVLGIVVGNRVETSERIEATAMDTIKELQKELETLKLELDSVHGEKNYDGKSAECDELRKLSGTGAGAGGVIGSRN